MMYELHKFEAAANVIKQAKLKKGSVKNLCYSSKFKRKRVLFALVAQTLKYRKVLEEIFVLCGKIFDNSEFDDDLKLVLLYETLFGKGCPNESQCEYGKVFRENKQMLLDALEKVTINHPELVDEHKTINQGIPRYVRVNTLKISKENTVEYFQERNFKFMHHAESDALSKNEFTIDKDIPDLMIFSPSTDFHTTELYKNGSLILQDKASCLPAFILNPPQGSIIIDACAAPGNKSSHLASIIKDKGTVYAFDLEEGRLKLMKYLLSKTSATCVQPLHQDFLKAHHNHPVYSEVEYILLDPSCSGSGIVSRMDKYLDSERNEVSQETEKRLNGLCRFQTAVLSHALGFPKVKKVIYSTCSIFQEENENVVEKAYMRFGDTFELVNVLPKWKNRGIGSWSEAYKCLRACTETDRTNGFFVAMFERKCHASTSIVDQETNNNMKKDALILKKKCKRKIVESETAEKTKCTLLQKETECDAIFQTKRQKLKKKRKLLKKPVT